jgi:hypothetical protein
MLHNLLETKMTVVLASAALATLLTWLLARWTEDPERKRARKMLQAITNLKLSLIELQLDGRGNQSRYDEANDLVSQSNEPAAEAQKAFNEGRYALAAYKAARALELLNKANEIQS